MSVNTMEAAPLIARTHVCMCCILYWLHYHLDENGAIRNSSVVLPNLPSCRERFYEPEQEITSDSEIPIPVMTASFHVIAHKMNPSV